MRTTIGRQLRDSSRNRVIAAALAVLAVGADFALLFWDHDPESIEGRWAVALLGLGVYLYLVQGDLPSVGLCVTPAQSWRYWFRAVLVIGFVVAGLIIAWAAVWHLLGYELLVHTTPPHALGATFLHMCVLAPLLEETSYRLLICVPIAAWGCPRLAVAVSGLLFAALHLVYGNPSPENLLGGLFLAWAYLKSGTICLPLLLHSVGNLCVLLSQLAAWYWYSAPA